MTWLLDYFGSPVGELRLILDEEGKLRSLAFPSEDGAAMRDRLPADVEIRLGSAPTSIREALAAYFAGQLEALDRISVETGGSSFERAAWAALRAIPPGQTRTYAQQAAAIGAPRAFRAVGGANHRNPVAIVIPCHRVIGADGSLTGYGGGMVRKRWLLAHEGALRLGLTA